MAELIGLKAQMKKQLRKAGINKVRLENGRIIPLANAKTSVLIQEVDKLG